jgi:ribosomal protein S18 acetylase RimI-like enzyme
VRVDVGAVGPGEWRAWRRVRRAALADAADAFGATLAEWSGAGDTEERWRARLAGVPLNLLLSSGGAPVGMVSATAPDDDGRVWLISLWVAPGARGHGVGDEAVRQVLAWAAARHPGSRVALSVRTWNEAAVRLYRRHGFTDAGPSPEDPDERLMVR